MSGVKTLVSWSSGKDSAWMLHTLRRDARYDIIGLVTTINEEAGRVAMHGVREELLAAQAAALDLPLWPVALPWPCSNAEYEQRMSSLIARTRAEGVEYFAFGDLFLADVRAYRERQLKGTGITPIFPLWGLDTRQLARDMMAGGLRAQLSCVDLKKLPAQFAGRSFDASLLDDLPHDADPCGEYGEFHTFCYAGPMFSAPITITQGVVIEREGFAFADLMPA